MGLLRKFNLGLQRTKEKLLHEINRVVTDSQTLDENALEEIENALISADLGIPMTRRIVDAVKKACESRRHDGLDVMAIARGEITAAFNGAIGGLKKCDGLTVVSLVGVNGTGKTTTSAKLAHRVQSEGSRAVLAACDTFRAAALEQIKEWGDRLDVPVVAGSYGADPAAVGHDAISAAQSRSADYLFIDTAGRLHTKSNLMQELEKLHRVVGNKLEGAPHEVLLVLDATTGMNALNQAREFHKAVPLTGLIIAKLDGTSKGGMVVAIHNELELPVKFIGLGEQPDDLEPFDAQKFAEALFAD
jgi:fused signal recognition particle receptor|tara:strand:- start:6026 stop:6934 length:909 start_codon:yes stop_codon:yes gene_type:complete